MATTTPIYGWPVPTSSDLVKNGATAIEALGDAADATMATMVPKSLVDAKGDIIAATAADTVARLAVGTANQVLTVDSSTATGLKWATPSAGASPTFSLINAGGTALTGATTVTVSGISGYDKFYILIDGASSANVSSEIIVQLNTATTNYFGVGFRNTIGSTYAATNFSVGSSGGTGISLGTMSANAVSNGNAGVRIDGGNGTGVKMWAMVAGFTAGGSNTQTQGGLM